jgi:hypothetical protein
MSLKISPLISVSLLLAACWVSVADLSPNRSAPAIDLPDGPSRQIMLGHLRNITGSPHPLGTPAHDQVRDYIVTALQSHGLTPEIHQATSILDVHELFRAADVQNILVRIPGTAPDGRAVLVASHYDSAPASHGAADDGASVVAMLELARLLQTGPRLPNAVILLFSDGEERGLLGARSFAASHPWANDVGAVINLEARGSGGRPVLIETSGSAPLLADLLADSGAPVYSASYVSAGYRRSGHDTDFSVFRQAGWPGYNLAFFDDPASYHTVRDTAERLNPASLALQANAVHRLTRQLAMTSLDSLKAQSGAVYTSLPGGWLLRYPETWAVFLPLAALVVCCVTAFRARKQLRLPRISQATWMILTGLIVSVVVLAGVNELLLDRLGRALVRWEQRDSFFVGAVGAGAAIALWCVSIIANRVTRRELVMAFSAVLAVSSLVLCFALPSASYLLAIPALAGSVSASGRDDSGRSIFHTLFWLPAVVLWAPTIMLLATGLGVGGQLAILPLCFLLAVATASTQFALVAKLRWRLAAVLLAGSGALYIYGWSQAGFNDVNPASDHLLLAVNTEANTAQWVTFDRNLDEWNRQLISRPQLSNLSAFFGGGNSPVTASPAALPQWRGSRIERRRAHDRTVDLWLTPEAGASAVRFDVYSEADIRSASINGRAVQPRSGEQAGPSQAKFTLVYFNPPSGGVPISLVLSKPEQIGIAVVDIRYGALSGMIPPRPPHIIPASENPTDCALVRRAFRFDFDDDSGG